MKRLLEVGLGLILLAMLLGIGWTIGWRQAAIGLVFSVIWFIIALVLLSKPPGIPEISDQDTSSNLPMIKRTDPLPVLPGATRLRISLCVACGVCLFLWMALGK